MDSIKRCKERLPMPDLWHVLGLRGEPRKVMRSPFREDNEESFSVFQRDGQWFFKDHARDDVAGDEIHLIMQAEGLDLSVAIKRYHELAKVPWEASAGGGRSVGVSKSDSRKKRATVADKKTAPKNTEYQPAWVRNGDIYTKGERTFVLEKIYDYVDKNGEVLHQTIRFAWTNEDGEQRAKDFRQRRRPLKGEKAAVDGWIYTLEGMEPVLYRLPEILAADANTPIFFVEGEKDADTLKSLGLVATTVPMGAGKWRPSYAKALEGKWVVVLGDNDEPGRKHVTKVCKELNDVADRLGAIYLAAVWPGCPDKGDITDWLDHCRQEPAALQLADSCEEEELEHAAAEALRTWAEEGRTPDAIRYAHCFGYGPNGGLHIFQNDLATTLVDERMLKYAGDVWWKWERTRWKQLEVQRDPRRWVMDAIVSNSDAAANVSSYLVNSVEDLMANRSAMHPDAFNAHDPNLINVGNGMLDIRDLSLRPHESKYLSTVQIPHRFDATATCPQFLAWLEEMLPAEDVRAQIQEIFGYCLAPGLNYHKFFFFYGDGGTGKSTCVDLITKLVGEENSVAIRLQELDNPFLRQKLVGKRLYLAPELDRDSFKHMGLVKAITSGDPIHVEKKHKDGFDYRPKGRFIMASNVRAQTNDTSDGFFRRLCQVTFENKIPEDRKDYSLLDKLVAEMDGILFWSLEGLQRLMARGRFEQTQDSAKAAHAIMMHRASAVTFFQDCIEDVDAEQPELMAMCGERMYQEYKAWCEWNHVKPYFEGFEVLCRELVSKMPWLDARKRRVMMEFDGTSKRRMCYRALRFKKWRPNEAMGDDPDWQPDEDEGD